MLVLLLALVLVLLLLLLLLSLLLLVGVVADHGTGSLTRLQELSVQVWPQVRCQ
jgi:hypothetical protein